MTRYAVSVIAADGSGAQRMTRSTLSAATRLYQRLLSRNKTDHIILAETGQLPGMADHTIAEVFGDRRRGTTP